MGTGRKGGGDISVIMIFSLLASNPFNHSKMLIFAGEHIDYCGYGVLPMAVEQDIVIAAGTNDEKMLNLSNTYNSFQ